MVAQQGDDCRPSCTEGLRRLAEASTIVVTSAAIASISRLLVGPTGSATASKRLLSVAEPGKPTRIDYEYERHGTANVFLFVDVNRPRRAMHYCRW